ncbi:transcriptional regulator GcvA [Pelagibius marinus]|uniref:transcriptional regulator GcvA n=1 Tax=Pelagibius marinus TaxID=2762760 RepID=UPI00187339CC|nr:transcriptional regulator GcvA [Pelagibius marinus]
MPVKLPPLNALRAFEAGARHLSFTKAADELHVTQAAVSHQVKALEEHLGYSLFKRMTRKLALTEQGRVLFPVVSEAFTRIAETAGDLRDRGDSHTLTVSVTPAFGAKWLVYRLPKFWEKHPDIDLRVHHSIQVCDLRNDDVDIAVRFGAGRWEGLETECIMRVDYTPVCSPALLEGKHPLRCPDDLKHHTLLHEDDYDGWTQWLATAGVKDVNSRRGPILDDWTVLVQTAIDGGGVALGKPSMLKRDIAEGRLVSPFDILMLTDLGYHLVYLPGALEREKVRVFREFILEEVGAEKA